MTYKEFVAKWNGEFCEVAGSANAKNQCVDLANAYIRDVLNLPIVEWTNAQDFPKKCLPPQYEYILNTKDGFPMQGDIVIWTSPDKIGHIAICDKADIKSLDCFGQNFPLGSNCHIQHHTYTTASKINVAGWLRCKNKPITNSEPDMTEQEKRILQFLSEQNADEGKVREAFGYLADKAKHDEQIATLSQKVLELDKFTKELQEKIDVLGSEVTASNKIIEDWQSQALSAKEQASKAIAQIQQANEDKNKYRRLYEGLLETTPEKLSVKQLLSLIIKKLSKK